MIFNSKKSDLLPAKNENGWKEEIEEKSAFDRKTATVPVDDLLSKAAANPKTETRSVKTEVTILTAETEFKGTLAFSGDLQLHGKLEGSIEAESGLLTIGETAMVKAEIRGQDVVIYGKVQGNIVTTGRLELRGHAQVYGDVRVGKIMIEEGALFVGRSENLSARQEEKPDFAQMFTKLKGESTSKASKQAV